jgi:ABC-type polysaccharide/polyol phosphate transport system ATPase subunit
LSAPIVDIQNLGLFYRLNRKKSITLKSALLGGAWRREESPVIWALDGVNLTCREGEAWGIVGPNGAGKSTLCLVLSQILAPDVGTVDVRGKVSTLLTLGAGFNKELSGRDNIYLNAAFLGIARSQVEKQLEEIIEFSELGDFIDQPIRFYSSGMRSRLGFSIAATLQPEILVLDEVLSVGDRAFKAKSQARIEEMMRESRLIVIVSHSANFLRETCTHCLWLEKGRVRASGACDEVLDAYEGK